MKRASELAAYIELAAYVMVVAGCAGAATPPTRDFIVLGGGDGLTATGPQLSVYVEADEPHVALVSLVTWPELEAVAHSVETEEDGRTVRHTVTATTPRDRWYAIRVEVDAGVDVQIAGGGVPVADRVWAFRFRPGSEPRIRSLGGVSTHAGSLDVEVEFSEPLFAADLGAISASVDGRPCTGSTHDGETAVSVSFACGGGAGETLTLSIANDISAPAGGILGAREIRTPVAAPDRDPV